MSITKQQMMLQLKRDVVYRRKSQAYYAELLEKLMDYTDYTSTSQIKTQADLRDFFKNLNDKRKREHTSGKNKKPFKTLAYGSLGDKQSLISAVWDSIASGVSAGRGRKLEKLKRSNKAYFSFAQAKQDKATARVSDKRTGRTYEIYKSAMIIYRTADGKRIKNKSVIAKIESARARTPSRYIVITKDKTKG